MKSTIDLITKLNRTKTPQKDVPYLTTKGLGHRSWLTVGEPLNIGGIAFNQSALYVPIYDLESDKQVTAQLITPDGDKRFLPDASTKNGGLWLNEDTAASPTVVRVVEGFATGLSLSDAFDEPVLIAFSAGSLSSAVQAAKKRYPNAKVIIGADNDGDKAHNTGVNVANAVAADQGAWVAVPPENGDWNDYYQEHGKDKTAQTFNGQMYQVPELPQFDANAITSQSAGKPFPFSIGSAGYDVVSQYLIKGLLPANSMGVVFGPSGHYKSFVVLSMACCIATNKPFDGYQINSAAVLYIAGEGGNGVPRRIKAWEQVHNQGKPIKDLAVISQPVYLTETGQMEALIETIAEIPFVQPLGLIIIDTLARCFAGADENKASDMNLFIAKCDELRRRTKATVLVVHHSGKDADKGARGSSALRAAADFEYSVQRVDDEPLTAKLQCTKMKDDNDTHQGGYRLQPKQLFKDSDGDAVTSLVVQLESFAIEEPQQDKPLPKNQMALWQAVRSRHQRGDDTSVNVVRDDLKKLGFKISNFCRWLDALIDKNLVKVEANTIIPL